MASRFVFRFLQIRKRLWVKPLLYCVGGVACVFAARLTEGWGIGSLLPEVNADTIEALLTIISSSMLAVATFAVGSMLQAYNSASDSATPRAFALVLADDMSKTALSSFIGAFIFSIVALVALKTGLYNSTGLFALFVLTLAIFAWVVLTFVRWTDSIARLGRLGSTIDKVESAAERSLKNRRRRPYMGGVAKTDSNGLQGAAVYCDDIGYVQHVDMAALQSAGKSHDLRFMVAAVPGTFLGPNSPLLIVDRSGEVADEVHKQIVNAFVVGQNRTFESDPRFGLVVLAEIAARALSPAVNDHGTAIVIIGRFLRLLSIWAEPLGKDEGVVEEFDRVIVPELTLASMFDDAFTALARDGARSVEVGVRLQKAFVTLSRLGPPEYRLEARRHSALALARAERAMDLPDDLVRLKQVAEGLA